VATRWLETYPIKSKTDVYSFIKTYKEKQENQSFKRIKAFKSDNGTEFTNSKVKELFTSSGIEHLLSAPYTPEQNGLIERINLTILNKIRCILTESNTTKELWPEALLASTYIYNRTPHSALGYKTPYEERYNTKPDISNLKIFGSISYYRNPNTTKLEDRSTLGILIGYGSNQYKVYNPITKRTIWTRDIKILEGKYYDPNTTSNKEVIED
jgi:hypothetical protein